MAVDETLAEILTLALGHPVAAGENLRRADDPKWDSLKHLEIVFATEAAFGVSFSAEEIAAIQDVAALRAKVANAP
jgi:acyl carrier protein